MLSLSNFIAERFWGAELAVKIKKVIGGKPDYQHALTALRQLLDRKNKEGKATHSVVYYAAEIAKSYANVDARELAKMYDSLVTESEAATNTTDGVANTDLPKFKKTRFAGCDCIDVDADTYNRCRFGKKPFSRWTSLIDDEDLRNYVKTHYHRSDKLLVREPASGSMMYIRR